eukprot:Clim_evm26s11 gene=Clim_evmTU26s11
MDYFVRTGGGRPRVFQRHLENEWNARFVEPQRRVAGSCVAETDAHLRSRQHMDVSNGLQLVYNRGDRITPAARVGAALGEEEAKDDSAARPPSPETIKSHMNVGTSNLRTAVNEALLRMERLDKCKSAHKQALETMLKETKGS